MPSNRIFNGPYVGLQRERVAYPLGGIGAGMICLEGGGGLSHVSLRGRPDFFHEPMIFSAISLLGSRKASRVLEGPIPMRKIHGTPGSGNGAQGKHWGLPRFADAVFESRFPFGAVDLTDPDLPIRARVSGWSPFTPGDPDSSSLPIAALEYAIENTGDSDLDAVYSFHSANFMAVPHGENSVHKIESGFVCSQSGTSERPWDEGAFSATVLNREVHVDCAWFRGGWWDGITMVWNAIRNGRLIDRQGHQDPKSGPSPGASLYVPIHVPAGQRVGVRLLLAWYVPETDVRCGIGEGETPPPANVPQNTAESRELPRHSPWYAGRFEDVGDLMSHWRTNYADLRRRTQTFSDCFYDTTLPPEIVEAVSANLTILKSPTVARQADGRFWGWEGCRDNEGCCHGSCTHVWNYAQAVPHLFPSLERTLRDTEFGESQDGLGHQSFRSALPIRPLIHDFYAAADGQLGGIMKAYRDWRISGDHAWIESLWPSIKVSLDYCIEQWDPDRKGVIEEPHHNTYDIEFWGANGMIASFYLGALKAAVEIARAVGDDFAEYETLLHRGRAYVEEELFNGEYFIQQVKWEGLRAGSVHELTGYQGRSFYAPEALELLEKEGPKYQYGSGCLSDGVLGAWMARVCGLDSIVDPDKERDHLLAVHRYNLRDDLSGHANPQRPGYAIGREGGLLLCTWPKGEKPSLPFIYSDEVWTGIEYQVAAHLIMSGCVEEGLQIVRTCRARYDGLHRNPFDEYECGHWYARALSSYSLLQAMTGLRYDAVDQILYMNPRIDGDFRAFLATDSGFGTAGIRDGEPFFEAKAGTVRIDRFCVGHDTIDVSLD